MIGGPGDDNRPCDFTAFVDPEAALTGGPGNDRIEGGPGNDSMNGIFDDDTLLGGTGDDLLRDGSPDDKDRLFGGRGTDTLDARDGAGDDLIDGGPGVDDCSGDANDTFANCERLTRVRVRPHRRQAHLTEPDIGRACPLPADTASTGRRRWRLANPPSAGS